MIQIEYLSILVSIIIIVYLLYLNKELINSINHINYKIKEYKIKRKIKSIYEAEQGENIRQELLEIAFLKIKSTNKIEKILGLEQLAQLSDEKDYNSLIKALKNEEDEQIQKYIINILCRIINGD